MKELTEITREMVRTPNLDHDWRTEPWLDEERVSDLDIHAAFCIVTAMAIEPEPGDPSPMAIEDELVFGLLRPDLMEHVWRSEAARDIVRARVVGAVAQCLARLREAWVERYGSAEAKGT